MNLNKAIIAGRLVRDPEVKDLPTGTKVASVSVATGRVYKDKSGGKREETEFHNVVMFGRTAEVAGQYLQKGQLVIIEGRIQTRNWEKDGQKHYRTEIICDQMQMGPRPGDAKPKTASPEEPDGDPGPAPTDKW